MPETWRKAGDSTGGERREKRRLIHPLLRQLEERYEGGGEPAPLTGAAVEVHGEGGGRRLALCLRRHTQPLQPGLGLTRHVGQIGRSRLRPAREGYWRLSPTVYFCN